VYAVLAEESLIRLCSNTKSMMDAKGSLCLHAHSHISNSAILNNNRLLLSDLCACVQIFKIVSLMKLSDWF